MKNTHIYIALASIFIIGIVVFFVIINKPPQHGMGALINNDPLLPVSDSVPFSDTALPEEVIQKDKENQKEKIINNKQKIMNATFKTNKGSFTVELLTNDAPKTTANFIKLAESGFYTGVKFHRVIKDFMIQSGDPLTKDDTMMSRWGTGGPGYQFADEIHANNKNVAGTIAMANAGPNTNGSQFFINTNDNNFLDTKHTVFGRVTSGMDVVQVIENVQTNQMDRPLDAVIIESITLK
jgi:peptidylprolyl isomerase/peptidyl-prolyl cis-trans isomerase A (cyclophilin A)